MYRWSTSYRGPWVSATRLQTVRTPLPAWPPHLRTWGPLTAIRRPDQYGPPLHVHQMTHLPVSLPYLRPHPACSFAFLHTSPWKLDPNKKAVVEKAVDGLKEKKNKVAPSEREEQSVVQPKPSLAARAKEVALHYFNGFRLLVLDVRVAIRLLLKTMQGQTLTRRERKLFRRTVADMFRIVPFSVFIIIPFMEFLLPVYVYFFPNALPSTFQSSSSKADRKKKELKVKLQMAKFLQGTVEEMAVTGRRNKKEAVQEFAKFFEKIRDSGQQASTSDLIRFSKLFEDELTLDNLSTPTLKALCRLLLLQPIGSSNFLRFQLRMKLRQLMTDDKMIQKEGVESLTVAELQAASQARGMRALGMPADRLRSQLSQWLELHLRHQVPSSLLLLSRALYLPDDVPNMLQATLSTLPQPIVEEAGVRVADSSGETVDNKTRLEVIRQQETLIKEEAAEKQKEREELEAAAAPTESMEDSAPVVHTTVATPTPPEEVLDSISAAELRDLNEAVASLKGERQLEEEIQELKEEREEYREDVAELAEESQEAQEALMESKASVRLGKRVEDLISQVDSTLWQLEKDIVSGEGQDLSSAQPNSEQVIPCEELEQALTRLKETSGEAKVRSLVSVLDPDHDGNINIREIAEVVESLAQEDTDIQPQHIALIKHLIEREAEENSPTSQS
ncbi:Mitochondrial proton/calcium exchanger protein [Geodia barretti]|uniref:Mitochondrial proton/calcium exchanger protein n=3 Tax=Geodia barretti TaxID=519541 RepID=A0AA35XI03_GEOBA|nr:Mitochondrial proton/calcium exchanger protein [Geodia barretti]